MRRAIIPFTGDPIHFGHIDLISRVAKEYDGVIVGFGVNASKAPVFSLHERMDIAKHSLAHLPNVNVVAFDGMLADYAYEQCMHVVEKGLRSPADFEYEKALHRIGESQELDIDTRMLLAKPEHEHLSSSSVKAIAQAQGMLGKYVPLFCQAKA